MLYFIKIEIIEFFNLYLRKFIDRLVGVVDIKYGVIIFKISVRKFIKYKYFEFI